MPAEYQKQEFSEMGKRSSREREKEREVNENSCKIGNSLNEKCPKISSFQNKKKTRITSALSSEASSSHFHRTDSQLFHKTELCVC